MSRAEGMKEVDVDLLRELVRLDHATGQLFWKPRQSHHFAVPRRGTQQSMCDGWNAVNAGKKAFCCELKGYLVGTLFDQSYKAHRVVFALVNGNWPVGEVDHINGDRADNRPENLREVDRTTNARNQKRSTRNRSGNVGVHFVASRQKWVAKVCGRTIGAFSSRDLAVEARRSAAPSAGIHPNHGRG